MKLLRVLGLLAALLLPVNAVAQVGGGVSGSGAAASACTAFGTTAGTCAQGNDSRFPTATVPTVQVLKFSSSTVTISNASPAVVTWTQTFAAGQAVQFTTTGALPAPLAVNTTYYVISAGLSGSQFEISATVGGTAINTTNAGSGTHTGWPTYLTPAGVQWIELEGVGGGGGGSGSGGSPGAGGDGKDSTFGASLTAGKGVGATAVNAPGTGGTASGCNDNITGEDGGGGNNLIAGGNSGGGGNSTRSGGGAGSGISGATADAGKANSGGGGAGGSPSGSQGGGAGGGSGATCRSIIGAPVAAYQYSAGLGGAAGTGGTGGTAGAAGGTGVWTVREHYNY